MDDRQRLRRAAHQSRTADAKADAARGRRNTLIIELLDKGEISQADICRDTGLTREHIRRIADAERKRRTTTPPAGEPDGTAATE